MAERKKRRGKKINRLKIRWHGFQKQTDNRVIDKQEAEWGEKKCSCLPVYVFLSGSSLFYVSVGPAGHLFPSLTSAVRHTQTAT